MNSVLPNPQGTADRIREAIGRQGWVRLALGAEAVDHPLEALEQWLLQVSNLLGLPVPQSSAGTLLAHIRNEGGDYSRHTTRGHQTNSELSFHSDRCDWNLLFYVRPARNGGEVAVVSYDEAAAALTTTNPTALEALFAPFPFDLREERIFAEPAWHCRPILWRNAKGAVRGHYIRRFILDSQRHSDCPRLGSRQTELLDQFDATIRSLAVSNRFVPCAGDLVVLDNYQVMHARSAFTDEADSPRLALRTWVAPQVSETLPPSLHLLAGSCLGSVFRGGLGCDAEYHARLGQPIALQ